MLQVTFDLIWDNKRIFFGSQTLGAYLGTRKIVCSALEKRHTDIGLKSEKDKMKGSNLSIGGSGAVNSSKSWVGRTLERNKVSMSSSTLARQYGASKPEEEDPEVPSATFNDFWNASILMSNTVGPASTGPSAGASSRVSNVRAFTSRAFSAAASPPVSLQSHRSRGPSTSQDFAFMTKPNSTSNALSLLPLSEALVTLSDILSVSLFALIRWWKHRIQSHFLQHPIFQLDSYMYNNYQLLQESFTLQLIPKRTMQLHQDTSDHSDSVVETQMTHGLKNHGQTCFLNSVIQALASLPPIIAYLETIALEQHLTFPSTSIVASNTKGRFSASSEDKMKGPSLTEMILGLLSSVGATSPRFHITTSTHIDTRDVLQKVGEKHMQFHSENGQDRSHLVQQDAQEFLQALMDMIVSEAEEVMGKSNNLIKNMENRNGEHVSLNSSTSQNHSKHNDDTSVSLDNLLDYVLDQQHKQHQEELQSMEYQKQKEAKVLLSQLERVPPPQSTSNNDEKKQDEWDHDENHENVPPALNTPMHSNNKDENHRDTKRVHNEVPASMRMLHSLSSTTPSPLSGWVGSLLQCNCCHHVRPIQNAPFLDIPLVPTTLMKDHHSRKRTTNANASIHHQQGRPVCTLEQCLSAFSKVERVQNVECYNCARLQKIRELEEEISLLKGGIQSRLDERKKKTKTMQNSGHDTISSRSEHDFNVDGLQSQLMECQERYDYYTNLDPDDTNSEKELESNMIHDDLSAYSDLLSQDQSTLSPPPRGVANKCLLLTRLPSILCFHVQRRFYDARLNRMLKSSSHVDFPEILDISSHCAYGNGGSMANQSLSTKEDTAKNKIEYRLMSAVEHKGNANSGHYQTYRRAGGSSERDKKWALISDENVKHVDWDTVKDCQAYMLFYEAI